MNTRPSGFELEVLGVLWQHGPSTVRDVFEVLRERRETGYTTVLKIMQIMAQKGLLSREEKAKAHIYRPAAPREQVQRELLKDLVGKAFGGSVLSMLQIAISQGVASRKDIAELRKLLHRSKSRSRVLR
jgi:predicted transcriptional regulator